MDSRTSAWLLTFMLALTGAGCITTQTQTSSPVTTTTTKLTVTGHEEKPQAATTPKKENGPKRNPMPRTEISLGQLKEADADADAIKADPELQSRLRDEARRAYQHALKIDPHSIEAYRHLGRLYTKTGDYERAFDTYKKAMALQPKDASLWYDLGQCHNRRKDFDESVRCFQRALELDPENREYMKKLGFTLAWTGQTSQGLAYLTRAQGSAMAQYNIGRILLQRGQREQAQQHLKLAVRENPDLEPLTREILGSGEAPASPSTQRGVETPTTASTQRGVVELR